MDATRGRRDSAVERLRSVAEHISVAAARMLQAQEVLTAQRCTRAVWQSSSRRFVLPAYAPRYSNEACLAVLCSRSEHVFGRDGMCSRIEILFPRPSSFLLWRCRAHQLGSHPTGDCVPQTCRPSTSRRRRRASRAQALPSCKEGVPGIRLLQLPRHSMCVPVILVLHAPREDGRRRSTAAGCILAHDSMREQKVLRIAPVRNTASAATTPRI